MFPNLHKHLGTSKSLHVYESNTGNVIYCTYAQLYKLWQTASQWYYLDNISSIGRRHKVEWQMIVAGKLEAFLSHLVVS